MHLDYAPAPPPSMLSPVVYRAPICSFARENPVLSHVHDAASPARSNSPWGSHNTSGSPALPRRCCSFTIPPVPCTRTPHEDRTLLPALRLSPDAVAHSRYHQSHTLELSMGIAHYLRLYPDAVARSRYLQSCALELPMGIACYLQLSPTLDSRLDLSSDPGVLPGFDEVSQFTQTPEAYAFVGEIAVDGEEEMLQSPESGYSRAALAGSTHFCVGCRCEFTSDAPAYPLIQPPGAAPWPFGNCDPAD